MSRTAYAASQAAACRSRGLDVVGALPTDASAAPDPLETCALVARLGTSAEALAEVANLLAQATGGPVEIVASAELANYPDGVVLPIEHGRSGALVLQPTVAAWSDPASAARIVLAQLLDRPPMAGRAAVSGAAETAAATLLDGFEMERRELAERLHRGVLQSLIGSRYLFDLARTTEGRSAIEALGMAREAVQEALAEGRALLRDVTPRVSDRASLEEEVALLPDVSMSSEGTASLSPVVAATTYRLLQAIARAGAPVTVDLADAKGRLRLTIDWLTDSDGPADREPSATGAGFVLDGSAPHLDRLRLIGVRVVEDGAHLILDLPVAPRLPVQRVYRADGTQPAGPTASTTALRPTQRAPRRSEGNT